MLRMVAVTAAVPSATIAVHSPSAVADTAAKSILWVACDDPDSLAAASSWTLNVSSMELALADERSGRSVVNGAGMEGGTLCLAYPGSEVPAGWGPHLVVRPCDPTAAEQRWAWKDQMLRYMGQPSSAAVCVQADAASPWINAPAATWPCPPKPSWNTAIARLNSTAVSGAMKLQLNMKVHKLCLSYGAAPQPAPTPPPPSPPPPPTCGAYGSKAQCTVHAKRCQWAAGECVARLATPTAEQLEWQDYEMGALLTVRIAHCRILRQTSDTRICLLCSCLCPCGCWHVFAYMHI
jgi:hypothetical protein